MKDRQRIPQQDEVGQQGTRPLKADLSLAILPTAIILIVFAVVQVWSRHQLLFASLASSAFLIYIDPEHRTNSTRTLVIAQGGASLLGFATHFLLGPSYWVAGLTMVIVIYGMILLEAMHPPAVSTALSFTFGAGHGYALALFLLCIGLVVLLVLMQRFSVWLLRRFAGNGQSAPKLRNPPIKSSTSRHGE